MLDSDDVKFIKKKTSVNGIEAHPTEDALIVTFQVDASLMGDSGSSLLSESKECQKMFRILNLDKVKDLDILALELIKRSDKLISYAQIDAVRQILMYLMTRKESVNDSAAKMENLRPKTAALEGRSKSRDEAAETEKKCLLDQNFWSIFPTYENQTASINELDDYVEKMYETTEEKMKGAAMILKLTDTDANLGEMADNETLLCALTRVLREDGRKSIELAILIIAAFAKFSEYSTFHDMITKYKIGSQTLDLINYELTRAAETSSRQSSASTVSSNPSSASGSRNVDSPSLFRDKSARKLHQNTAQKQNQLLRVSFYLLLNLSEDPKLEVKIVRKGVIDHLIKTLDRESDADLLILTLKFLLKLSIYRENKEIISEKAIMEKLFILFSFGSKCPEINYDFMTAILGLAYNLSFDKKLTKNLIQVGMVSKLLIFWSRNKTPIKKSLEQLIIKILYQISREPAFRRSFDFSPSPKVESIDLFMNKVMRTLDVTPTNQRPMTSRYPKSLCPIEVMTLVINLSLDYKIAAKMASDGKLTALLKHVYGDRKPNDPIDLNTVYVVKVIRNLSITSHEYKTQFVPFVDKISTTVIGMNQVESKLTVMKRSTRRGQSERLSLNDDMIQTFLMESLAILGNLNEENLGIEWFEILSKLDGFNWLMSRLTKEKGCEEDLMLEVVILLGTICCEEKCASHFVTNKGMDLVTELLDRLQEDDEIVLQTLFLIHIIAEHQILKQEMTGNSKLSSLLLELMNDNNEEIKKLASATLDIFSTSHQVWANKVRMESFRAHNQQWLQMVQSTSDDLYDERYGDGFGDVDDDEESDQEVELYDVLRTELLNSSLDSPIGSKSASPPSSYNDYDGRRPKTAQRPLTGYGRR